MIPNVGPLEIAIVLIIALIVFGPKRLPELGKSLGRGISEFKDGISSVGDSMSHDSEQDQDDDPVELTAAEAPAPAEGDPGDPEVTEVRQPEAQAEAEPVDGEVVADRQD